MRHSDGWLEGRGGIRLHRQHWWPDLPPRGHVQVLHGLGDHGGMHQVLVDRLVTEGFAAHAVDLRGYGRSAGRRAALESWADYHADVATLHQWLRMEHQVESRTLIGISLGALLALDVALRTPEGVSQVVAASTPLGESSVPRWLMRLAHLVAGVLPGLSLRTRMDITALANDPAVVEEALADPLFHRVGTARLAVEAERAMDRVRAALPEIVVPVLMVHGADDTMVPPGPARASAAAAGPQVRWIEYPGMRHALFPDVGGDRVLGDVVRFVGA